MHTRTPFPGQMHLILYSTGGSVAGEQNAEEAHSKLSLFLHTLSFKTWVCCSDKADSLVQKIPMHFTDTYSDYYDNLLTYPARVSPVTPLWTCRGHSNQGPAARRTGMHQDSQTLFTFPSNKQSFKCILIPCMLILSIVQTQNFHTCPSYDVLDSYMTVMTENV